MFKLTEIPLKSLSLVSQKFYRSNLKQRLYEVFPKKIAQFRNYRRDYGEYQIGSLTVKDVIDGCPDSPILFYEGSVNDPKTVALHFLNVLPYFSYHREYF